MKPTTKTLAAAALAGLFAAGTAMAGVGHVTGEKEKCSGKDGCDGKKKEKSSLSITAEKDKEKCSGKDGCDGKKKKDGDKEKCSGKGGCEGKDKKESTIL